MSALPFCALFLKLYCSTRSICRDWRPSAKERSLYKWREQLRVLRADRVYGLGLF